MKTVLKHLLVFFCLMITFSLCSVQANVEPRPNPNTETKTVITQNYNNIDKTVTVDISNGSIQTKYNEDKDVFCNALNIPNANGTKEYFTFYKGKLVRSTDKAYILSVTISDDILMLESNGDRTRAKFAPPKFIQQQNDVQTGSDMTVAKDETISGKRYITYNQIDTFDRTTFYFNLTYGYDEGTKDTDPAPIDPDNPSKSQEPTETTSSEAAEQSTKKADNQKSRKNTARKIESPAKSNSKKAGIIIAIIISVILIAAIILYLFKFDFKKYALIIYDFLKPIYIKSKHLLKSLIKNKKGE